MMLLSNTVEANQKTPRELYILEMKNRSYIRYGFSEERMGCFFQESQEITLQIKLETKVPEKILTKNKKMDLYVCGNLPHRVL
jgi:hypothetical protein